MEMYIQRKKEKVRGELLFKSHISSNDINSIAPKTHFYIMRECVCVVRECVVCESAND